MSLSTPKKVVFSLLAVCIPLILIEFSSYALVRLFFPQVYLENKKNLSKSPAAPRTDYGANDFSKENYDYAKDFYGPYLHDTSLTLPERLIGPRAVKHYLRLDHYTLFPFTMFHLQRNYRSAIVNTNHLGFRAREFSEYQADPRPKIIILGGSALFGSILSGDDKTVSAQLEAYLRQKGKDVTCINLAMGGYTSEQEMIILARLGLRLNPAAVIAIDGCNDVVHSLRHRDLPHLFPDLANLFYEGIPPNSSPGNYVKSLIKHWGRYSSFFCLADMVSTKFSTKDPNASKMDNCILFPGVSDEDAIVDNYINAHAVMSNLCKARNIKYIAGLQPLCGMWVEPRWEGEIPQSIQSNPKFVKVYASLDAELEKLARQEGFIYQNFGKVLAGSDNLYNFSDPVHLTDASAGIIARKLGDIMLNDPQGRFGALTSQQQ